MAKQMLINASEEESRVAIVEDGVLQDLHVESVQFGRTIGNIYKGTVVRVEPALQACFVDFGAERNGFLAMGDISSQWWRKQPAEGKRPRIEDALAAGMHLMVQSVKEPVGNKGAALTTHISLAGRYLVFMPDPDSTGGVSRKIEDAAQRERLKKLQSQLSKQRKCSLIIRSVAADRTKAELERDLGYLDRLWKTIQADFKRAPRPGPVFSEQDVVIRVVRDYFTPEIDRVIIDGKEAFGRALDYVKASMPHHRKRFENYEDAHPLFLRYGIEAQIEETYRKNVRLPAGGEIVIDPTEALVAVDVNSGRAMSGKSMEQTALRTNVEAAKEVARQLRLRDLGGLIVIDFIDLRETANRRKVERALKQALKGDKARHNIGRIGQFGLLEMSRQRLQGTVVSVSHDPCPSCLGSGVVRSASSGALAALRRIRSVLADPDVNAVEASVPRAAGVYLLNEKREALLELERRLGVSIRVVPTDISAEESGRYVGAKGPRAERDLPDEDDFDLAIDMDGIGVTELLADAEPEPVEEPDVQEEKTEAAPARRRRRRSRGRGRGRGRSGSTEDKPEGASGSQSAAAAPSDEAQTKATSSSTEARDQQAGEEGAAPRRRRRRRRGGRGRGKRSGAAASDANGKNGSDASVRAEKQPSGASEERTRKRTGGDDDKAPGTAAPAAEA